MADEILRGFEIVRTRCGQVITVIKYKPTELAAKQAAADVKWFQMQHPEAGYELRAIVSVPREPGGGGATADPAQLELPLDTEVAVAEARVEAGEYDVVESR